MVTVPTKRKDIGRKATKTGCPQPDFDEATDAARSMSEIPAQNAAGSQWVIDFMVLRCW